MEPFNSCIKLNRRKYWIWICEIQCALLAYLNPCYLLLDVPIKDWDRYNTLLLYRWIGIYFDLSFIIFLVWKLYLCSASFLRSRSTPFFLLPPLHCLPVGRSLALAGAVDGASPSLLAVGAFCYSLTHASLSRRLAPHFPRHLAVMYSTIHLF